jgi:hypothetical protein
MVAKREFGGLILECGAKVVWLKHLPGIDKSMKRFRFRKDRQLDLFDDLGNSNTINTITEDLTKVDQDVTFSGEGCS